MTDVFVSHTNADRDFVRKLANDLYKRGLTVRSIDDYYSPGDHWAKIIRDAIHDSQNILVVLSEDSGSSPLVRAETATALALGAKRIVPIYLTKNVDVPFMLRAIHGMDLSNPDEYESSIDRLVDLLRREKNRKGFDSETDNAARFFQAQLEASALEQEKINYSTATRLRASNIRLYSVAAATTCTMAAIAAAVLQLAGTVSDTGPLLMGMVAGIVTGLATGFIGIRLRLRFPRIRDSKVKE